DIYNQAENHLYRTKLIESYLYKQGLINILIHNLFEKHQEIKAHSERVANLCQHIAKKLGLDEHDIEEIYVAGRLHDIGKIGLNEKLLHQSSEFNKEQLLSFQRHSELGFHLLKSVQYFGKIADWVLSHHEQPDGKGYPRGLKGYQIPIQSRIIHVANSFDLATLHLKEKNKETISLVLQLLDEKKGTMYDSRILEALQSLPLEVLMEDKIG
ncbi:MAG: HD domain-containing protein, partial [Spirochaetia bacterium]|nr:HD domain-containing protein [Spirochaetia bacterium]